jgi:hypothetical protein
MEDILFELRARREANYLEGEIVGELGSNCFDFGEFGHVFFTFEMIMAILYFYLQITIKSMIGMIDHFNSCHIWQHGVICHGEKNVPDKTSNSSFQKLLSTHITSSSIKRALMMS